MHTKLLTALKIESSDVYGVSEVERRVWQSIRTWSSVAEQSSNSPVDSKRLPFQQHAHSFTQHEWKRAPTLYILKTCEYIIWEMVKRNEIATIVDMHDISEKHHKMKEDAQIVKRQK